MAEDPSEIREAIDETRAELADTVEALGQKADVKGRAQDKATESKDQLLAQTEQLRSTATDIGHKVAEATPQPVRDAASGTVAHARRKPAPYAAGAALLLAIVATRRGRRRRQRAGGRVTKLLYKPLGLVISVIGGLIASALFSRAWKLVAHEDDAPKAIEAHRGWREVLIAAALQGAVFGVVKAAVDRGGATGFSKATGTWPGDE